MEDERKLGQYPVGAPERRATSPCFKYTLVCFNVLFLVSGLASIIVGAWMIIDCGRFDIFFGIYQFLHPSGMLICAGGLAVFVMFCGLMSIMNRNRCCLQVHISFLILILTAEFVAGGLAFSYRTTVKAEITTETKRIIQNKYGTGDMGLDYTIDILQKRMGCCGAFTSADYRQSEWIKTVFNTTKYVPESCCSHPAQCAVRTQARLIYAQGCIGKLYELTDLRYKILGAVGIGIGCLQFVGMCLTWYYTIIL